MNSVVLVGLVVALFSVQQAAGDVLRGVHWGTFNQRFPQHRVRGDVRLLNSKTIQLENFNFDGQGIIAYVYYFSPGQPASPWGGGQIIPVPGSNFPDGRFTYGRRYNGETMTLPLPDGVDVCDIGTLTIWCEAFKSIFNSVTLRRDVFELDGDPCVVLPQHIEVPIVTMPPPLDNCMFLDPSLQLRWRVDRQNSNVRFQLCGCLSSNPSVDQYMGFGVSGSSSGTLMIGADPTITWVDTNAMPNAQDYHLSAYTQCVTNQGACPDTVTPGCSNDATLVTGFRDDRQQCVTFTRPFTPSDVGTCDRALDPDDPNQYVVWGVGGLGTTAFRHFIRASAGDAPIHLGRTPVDQCGNTTLSCATCPSYEAQRIVARESTTFRAVIGPSGNDRGYMAITGRPSWGISWYLDGIMAPELVVERGRTYSFIVEGGDDSSVEAAYHPFYITDSIAGSRISDPSIRNTEVVYAGFDNETETAVGRLCVLDESPAALASRTSCQDISDYLSKLVENPGCSEGQPGSLTWTPDQNTPDTVFYQCATHKNLGWRIRVINEGDPLPIFNGTTVSVTTPPVTTPPVTTVPITTPPVTTDPITTPPVTTVPITTPPETTDPITTPLVTTDPITTPPVTTGSITTPPETTDPITTPPVTTDPITTPLKTTDPITTPPETTDPITTPPVTTGSITTPPVTTGSITTSPPVTTNSFTTPNLGPELDIGSQQAVVIIGASVGGVIALCLLLLVVILIVAFIFLVMVKSRRGAVKGEYVAGTNPMQLSKEQEAAQVKESNNPSSFGQARSLA